MIKRQQLKCPLISIFVLTSCGMLIEISLLVSHPVGGYLGFDKIQAKYTQCDYGIPGEAYKLYLQKQSTSFSYSFVILSFILTLTAFTILLVSLIKFITNKHKMPIEQKSKQQNKQGQLQNKNYQINSEESDKKYYDHSFKFWKFVFVYICISISICGIILEFGVSLWMTICYRVCKNSMVTSLIALSIQALICLIILSVDWILLNILRYKFHEYFDNYQILPNISSSISSEVISRIQSKHHETLMNLITDNQQKVGKPIEQQIKAEKSLTKEQRKQLTKTVQKQRKAHQRRLKKQQEQNNKRLKKLQKQRQQRIKKQQQQWKKKQEELQRKQKRQRKQKTKILHQDTNSSRFKNGSKVSSPNKSKIKNDNNINRSDINRSDINRSDINRSDINRSDINRSRSKQKKLSTNKYSYDDNSHKYPEQPRRSIYHNQNPADKQDKIRKLNRKLQVFQELPQQQDYLTFNKNKQQRANNHNVKQNRVTPKFETQDQYRKNSQTSQISSSRFRNNLPNQSNPYFRRSKMHKNQQQLDYISPISKYDRDNQQPSQIRTKSSRDGNFQSYFQKQSSKNRNLNSEDDGNIGPYFKSQSSRPQRKQIRINDQSYERGKTEQDDGLNYRNLQNNSNIRRSRANQSIRGRFQN